MKRVKRQFKQISKTALLSLVFSLTAIVFSMGLKVVLAVWQPAGSSPPLDNVYTPLDVSIGHQVKKGFLLIDPAYNPYGEIPMINYPLEVKGAGADITSHLGVLNGLRVDNYNYPGQDYTLYVNSTTNQVGIGTMNPATKLNIEGGALKITTGVDNVNALEGYSSASYGVYGQSSAACSGATCYAGIHGHRASGAGLTGAGVRGDGSVVGVYGWSNTGIGVYGESYSSTMGAVYALNTNAKGWAGYFEGRVYATSEVAGNKFLPTKLQNSLVSYTSGWRMGDYQVDTAPQNLVFDGTYIWTANTGVDYNTHVSQIRASDGVKIRNKNLTKALDIAFDGTYVWVSSNDGANGKIYAFNPSSPESWLGVYSIDKDAGNIIATSETDAAGDTRRFIWYASTSTGKVRKINSTGVVQCTYPASATLSNPQGLAFDGTNIWIANYGGNNIVRIDNNCGNAATFNITSPHRIIFDGTNLWVTRKTAATQNNLVKVTLEGQTVNYSTGVNNPYDLVFDGTYIWVTHESSTQVVRLRASDGQGATSYNLYGGGAILKYLRGIIFDGTYLWVGWSAGQQITKFYSGTGWGYPDLSSYLTLQGSTVVAQTGSFHISGSGKLGGNFTAGGNIEALNNVWDGLGDSQKAFGYGCKEGEFVKGIMINNAILAKTKWTNNGELISSATNDQSDVQSAPDGEGGAILVWQDKRTGNRDIYAQRVNSNGNRLWENGPGDYNGIPIATTANSETSPDIAADGYGGAYLTWTGGTSGGETIFVQRIDKNGQKLWGANGIEIDPIVPLGPGFNPKVMRSSDDYMILVFNAWSTPLETIGDEILALKFDKNGNIPPGTTWAASPRGVYVIQKGYDQNSFVITSDQAGGVIVSWNDARSVNPGVYTQRINTNGDRVWGSDGILVNSSSGAVYSHIISDGAGGAIVVWNNSLTQNIYSQRFDGNGQKLWASDVVISSFTGSWTPKIISDESGGVIITWSDTRNGDSDVYAQRVNATGNLLWNSNGVPISVVAGSLQQVSHVVAGVEVNIMVSDGRGGAIIVWRDTRNGEEDVYTQRVDKDGQIRWDLNGVPITLTIGSQSIFPVVVNDEAGGGIIAWDEYPYGFKDIYAQKIDDASALLCRPL